MIYLARLCRPTIVQLRMGGSCSLVTHSFLPVLPLITCPSKACTYAQKCRGPVHMPHFETGSIFRRTTIPSKDYCHSLNYQFSSLVQFLKPLCYYSYSLERWKESLNKFATGSGVSSFQNWFHFSTQSPKGRRQELKWIITGQADCKGEPPRSLTVSSFNEIVK